MGDSDSENEGSQTNVNRLVIRPPGHTGDMELNIDEVICIEKYKRKGCIRLFVFFSNKSRSIRTIQFKFHFRQ